MRQRLTDLLLLIFLLIAATAVRLYKIDNPIADWHSFRQADTSSVTRQFVKHGLNLIRPTYHDLSNVASNKENPNGYRMVEFPIYNLLHYTTYTFSPSLGIDKAGRLTSVGLSLISLIFLYLLAKKLSDRTVAFWSAFFWAFLPFNIYYSRVILPEPLMVAAGLMGSYLLLIGLGKNGFVRYLALLASSILVSLALLAKPYFIFFTLPLLYWQFKNRNNSKLSILEFVLYWSVAVGPLLVWRSWIRNFPEGIASSSWLLNGNGIRLRPAWFRWLFAERLGKLIFGYYLSLLFIFGLFSSFTKKYLSFLLFFIGILGYFVVFANGNVTHDYYQAITIPYICLLLGLGLKIFFNQVKSNFFIKVAVLCVVISLSLSFSWYEIKGYYQINNPSILSAGAMADKLLPPDAKVIAPYTGDTAFLYQTNRTGWASVTRSLTSMVNDLGATHFVSVNYDRDTNAVMKQPGNTILYKDSQFVIIKLSSPVQP